MDLQKLSLLAHFVFPEIASQHFEMLKQLWLYCAILYSHARFAV